MLSRTHVRLTATFSTVRPVVDRSQASMNITLPITDSKAKRHDYRMLKSLLDSLTNLAQSRL